MMSTGMDSGGGTGSGLPANDHTLHSKIAACPSPEMA
jgi:hypothetical protein